MKLHHTIAGLGLSALMLFAGCSDGAVSEAANGTQGASAAVNEEAGAADAAADADADLSTPNTDTLVARSVAHWDLVVAADWIQAYDFLEPARKAAKPLGQYISGKVMHEYRNPSAPQLIGTDGDKAFLELSVLWEPHHPQIQNAANAPDDMTEELHMVEIWRWVKGEWYFTESVRANEFHQAHPGLGKGK